MFVEMVQVRDLQLFLLLAFLPKHHLIVEGAEAVTSTTSGANQVSCKEFTFSAKDIKNAKSDDDLMNIWRIKMVEVENFIQETLLAQNGEININAAIIPHDVTTTASLVDDTTTIISNHTTLPVLVATTTAQKNITKPGCPQMNLTFTRDDQVEDYVLYNGSTVPQLISVSICTWLTPLTGKDIGKGSVLSYYKYDSNDAGGNTVLIYFWSNSQLSIWTRGSGSHFALDKPVRDRTHFCFLISTVERKAEIFKNGISLGQKYISRNAAIPAGGALVIGNDQDRVTDPNAFLGSMTHWQDTFTGTIENLYIWNRILGKDEIGKLYNDPCACPRDHIIALTDANVKTHGEAQVSSLRNDCD